MTTVLFMRVFFATTLLFLGSFSFPLESSTLPLASDLRLDQIDGKLITKGLNYLTHFGYLPATNHRSGKFRTIDDIISAIKRLQKYAGLKITGLIDEDTMKLINTTRCSLPDFGPSDRAKRRRRYALQGTYWQKKDLTFRILNYTPDLSKNDIHKTIIRAFDIWAEVTPLTFTERTTGEADIMIKFVRGWHEDSWPFDGEGGYLAHAFFPSNNLGISGDTHFDLDEHWTLKSSTGTDFFWVAVHEFGHALGLDHSSVRGSIMFPWYQGYHENLALTEDDIRGIHQLYGMPEVTRNTMKPEATLPTMPAGPHPCRVNPDTAFVSKGKTYFFTGQYYFSIGDTTGVEEGPKLITDQWTDLPGDIDAAYSRPDKTTVFFKNDMFWEYNGFTKQSGPNPISDLGLPQSLNGLDAAFIWGGNSKTYFFKGSEYWRYDEKTKSLEAGYPKSISENWARVPDDIDTVFMWKNGRTYFFKDGYYYGLDDKSLKIHDYYPREVNRWWMGCSESVLKSMKSSASMVVSPVFGITLTSIVAKSILSSIF